MSSTLRKLPERHPVVVDIGCNCRRLKLSFLFTSTSRTKAKATLTDPVSPTTTTTTSSFTAATFTATAVPSACEDTASQAKLGSAAGRPRNGGRGTRRRKKGKVARESVAVVKESAEPYADFRESMVQMIVEKEIYAWEDLNDLLHRFLALNSPRHHHFILRAFTDIWSGVFAPPSTSLFSNR